MISLRRQSFTTAVTIVLIKAMGRQNPLTKLQMCKIDLSKEETLINLFEIEMQVERLTDHVAAMSEFFSQ